MPEDLNGSYVSGIYIVFRVKKEFQDILTSEYILHILKSPCYLGIIGKYDTKYGAVRANLTYEQLCNIKIPLLDKKQMKGFLEKINKLNLMKKEFKEVGSVVKNSMQEFLP